MLHGLKSGIMGISLIELQALHPVSCRAPCLASRWFRTAFGACAGTTKAEDENTHESSERTQREARPCGRVKPASVQGHRPAGSIATIVIHMASCMTHSAIDTTST